MTLLFIPCYDAATRGNRDTLLPLRDSRATTVALIDGDANRANLISTLASPKTTAALLVSHGLSAQVDQGAGNDPALTGANSNDFECKTLFVYACLTALDLGRMLVAGSACDYYFGYVVEVTALELKAPARIAIRPIFEYILSAVTSISDFSDVQSFQSGLVKECMAADARLVELHDQGHSVLAAFGVVREIREYTKCVMLDKVLSMPLRA